MGDRERLPDDLAGAHVAEYLPLDLASKSAIIAIRALGLPKW